MNSAAAKDRMARPLVAAPAYGAAPKQTPAAIEKLAFAWLLVWPFVYFSGHGYFSFQFVNSAAGRNSGFFGTYVFPGSAYLIVCWAIVTHMRRITAVAMRMKLFVLLALLTMISFLWSQNPAMSVTNSLSYTLDTLFGMYLVVAFEPEELMSLTILSGVAVSVLGLMVIVFLPQYGLSHLSRTPGAWQGLFIDRTASAKTMVFLISPAIAFWRRGFDLRRVAYLLLMLVFIIKGEAVTAIIVLGTYVLGLALLHAARAFDRKTAIVVSLVGIPIAAILVFVGYRYVGVVLALFGRDLTLTGRTEIWDTLLRSVAKRPLLGYGFYAFWQGLAGESANAIIASRWVFGYAHNGYLEIVLQVGLIGGAIFLATFLQAIYNAWYCLRKGSSVSVEWYAGLLLLTLIYNFSEATVFWPHDLLSILYVVACCGLAQAARQIKLRSVSYALASGPRAVFTGEEVYR